MAWAGQVGCGFNFGLHVQGKLVVGFGWHKGVGFSVPAVGCPSVILRGGSCGSLCLSGVVAGEVDVVVVVVAIAVML